MQIPILVLTFLTIYQLSNRIKISPAAGAGIVVSIPLLLQVTLSAIRGANLPSIIGWYETFMVLFLFVSYLFVFHKSQQSDSIVSWITWGVTGIAIVPIITMWTLSWFR